MAAAVPYGAGVDLDAWLAGLRAGEEAGSRRRQRSLQQQVSEEASFRGVLVDLADHRRSVAVDTVVGSRPLELRGVGIDFCAGIDRGRWVLVALHAVAAVRPLGGGLDLPGGSRAVGVDATLLEALADLLGDRPRVAATLVSGEPVTGELRSVGTDVVTLRADGDPARAVHLSTAHLVELVV